MKLTYLHVISIPRKEFRNLLFEGNYGHILFVRIEYTSDSVASIQHSWKPANRRMWREVDLQTTDGFRRTVLKLVALKHTICWDLQ